MKRFILFILVTLLLVLSACTGLNGTTTPPISGDYNEEVPENTQKPEHSPPTGDTDDVPKPDDSEADAPLEETPNIPPTNGDTPNTPPAENSPIPPVKEPETAYAAYACSKVDGLRVRAGKGSSYAVLGHIDKNDMVLLIAEEGDYLKTYYKEATAYIHKSYCTVIKIEQTDERVEKALSLGSKMLGYPYVWGSQRYHWGNGVLNTAFVAGEFDCSAFVQYIFYHAGNVLLDVTSRKQSLNGKAVTDGLKRGDLMFFTNASRKNKQGIERIGHVGIYLGENYILHTASDHSVIEPISKTRWSYFITARRVL